MTRSELIQQLATQFPQLTLKDVELTSNVSLCAALISNTSADSGGKPSNHRVSLSTSIGQTAKRVVRKLA